MKCACALLLASLTLDDLMPKLLGEDWIKIASIKDPQERLHATREQASGWWRNEDEEQRILDYLLHLAAEVLTGELRLRGMAGDYSKRSGGKTAIQISRAVARHCGEILAGLDPGPAEELLSALPGPQESHRVTEAAH